MILILVVKNLFVFYFMREVCCIQINSNGNFVVPNVISSGHILEWGDSNSRFGSYLLSRITSSVF